MRLLFGNYDLTIDDKNRLLVPSDIRKQLDPETDGEAFFALVGTNRKLWLYPEKYYEAFALRMTAELTPEDDALAYDQMNFAMASRIEWDKQGRILVPEKLMKKCGLARDVTVIGARNHVEIWNRPDWQAQEEELDRRRAEIAVKNRQRQPGTA